MTEESLQSKKPNSTVSQSINNAFYSCGCTTALATAENQTVHQAGQEKNQYLAVARQTTPN